MRKIVANALLVFFFIITLVGQVYAATASVWCDPGKIPPGGEVTIHIRANFADTNITKMEVINPDDITWKASFTGNITLPDEDDEVAITFPGGAESEVTDISPDNIDLPDVTWPAGANTNTHGKYTVYVYGEDETPVGSRKFDVSAYFSVPEFALTSIALTAVSFAALALTRRRFKKP